MTEETYFLEDKLRYKISNLKLEIEVVRKAKEIDSMLINNHYMNFLHFLDFEHLKIIILNQLSDKLMELENQFKAL